MQTLMIYVDKMHMINGHLILTYHAKLLTYVMKTFCVDKMINGHLILLQLVIVQPCWRSFGSAAGLDEETLDNVSIKDTHNRIMPTLKL